MIEQKFASHPESYTYHNAMYDLRTDVLRRNQPNSDGGYDFKPRRIKEYNTKKKQHYKQSYNKQPFNQNRKKSRNYHKDAKRITLKNGKQIWYHHSFIFDNATFRDFTDQQKSTLHADRKAAEEKTSTPDRTISQLESKLETMSKTMESFISQVQSGASVPSQIHMFQGSQS